MGRLSGNTSSVSTIQKTIQKKETVFAIAERHAKRTIKSAYTNCYVTSHKLFKELQERGYKATIVFGGYAVNAKELESGHKRYRNDFDKGIYIQPHTWVEYNNTIYDTTTKQFGGPDLNITASDDARYLQDY